MRSKTLLSIFILVGSTFSMIKSSAQDNQIIVWDSIMETKDTTITVWDGETATKGSGWANPASTCSIGAQESEAHSGNTALEFRFKGDGVNGWLGCGWNWVEYQLGEYGTDITIMTYFTFWLKVKGTAADFSFNLLCNGATAFDMPEHHTEKVIVSKYCPEWKDGQWHQVIIPLKDLKQPLGFDPLHVAEMQFFNTGAGDGSFFLDDIAFTGPDTIISYKINASATTGGTLTPNGEISIGGGANLTFKAAPASGYKISEIKVDGVSKGAVSSYTFTKIESDHSIEASFISKTTSINLTQSQTENSFLIAPNPLNNNNFTVKYFLAELSPIEFYLYDLNGKIFEKQKLANIPALCGEFNWTIHSKLDLGEYVISMHQKGLKVAVCKLIKI